MNFKGSNNSRVIVLLGTFFVTAIGYLIAFFVESVLMDILSVNPSDTRIHNLLLGLTFFSIAVIVYFGIQYFVDYEEEFGINIFFFVLWIVCTLGLVIGWLVWSLLTQDVIQINLDNMIDNFFFSLTLALIPALAATLAISTR
ncbi:MAG: hypothetical protein ACFFDI_24650 [Promethearchaeota archaeon]